MLYLVLEAGRGTPNESGIIGPCIGPFRTITVNDGYQIRIEDGRTPFPFRFLLTEGLLSLAGVRYGQWRILTGIPEDFTARLLSPGEALALHERDHPKPRALKCELCSDWHIVPT